MTYSVFSETLNPTQSIVCTGAVITCAVIACGCRYSDTVLPMSCETHGGRAIEYYCETDQVAVCSQCALIGDHQGHQITTIDEKVHHLTSPHCLLCTIYM